MAPAMRPFVSWSEPSWGLTWSEVSSLKDIGSAPNFSESASSLPLDSVKPPVIFA